MLHPFTFTFTCIVTVGVDSLNVDAGRPSSHGLELSEVCRVNGPVCAGLCEPLSGASGVKVAIGDSCELEQDVRHNGVEQEVGTSSAIDLTMYANSPTARRTVCVTRQTHVVK